MSILLRGIGIVLLPLLATGMFVAVAAQLSETAEIDMLMDFGDRIQAGMVSSDPAQWNDENRKEFFGNMPSEYHQKFLDAFSNLQKAKSEYWSARAELFEVLHPLFKEDKKEGKEFIKEIEDAFNEAKKKFEEDKEANKDEWEAAQKEYDYYKAYEEAYNGKYGLFAVEQSRQHDAWYLVLTWSEFRQYPELLDPQKQTEFWNARAAEILFLYEQTVEATRRQAEEYKKQVTEFQGRIDKMTLEDLPQRLQGGVNSFQFCDFDAAIPLSDEQKSKIIGDEPFFHLNIVLHLFGNLYNISHFSTEDAHTVLKEARDTEREQWKIDATPELAKLGITQAEVDRWDGSLSMHPFIRNIAERCEGINMEGLQTSVDQPSSRAVTGKTLSNTFPAFTALIQGEKDVVFSGRSDPNMKIAEAQAAGIELVFVPFAKDAFVFMQNRQNPVRSLTLEQYQGVFSGKYRNWNEVGGFGGEIRPFIRNEESGSEALMKFFVMRDVPVHEDFKPKEVGGMGLVFEELENTPTGIAYSIYHFDRYMMFNPNTRVMAVNGVLPDAETIASGKYPLIYECVLVHRKKPGEKVERLVQWLLSDEGQRLVRSIGYVPR